MSSVQLSLKWLVFVIPAIIAVACALLSSSIREAARVANLNAQQRRAMRVIAAHGGVVQTSTTPLKPLVQLLSGEGTEIWVAEVYFGGYPSYLHNRYRPVPQVAFPRSRELLAALCEIRGATLSVQNTDFNNADLAQLATSQFWTMHAGRTDLDDQFDEIQVPPQLTSIDIHDTQAGDLACCKFAQAGVERLNLRNTGVTDKGIECLRKYGKPRSISISGKGITSEGVRTLCKIDSLTSAIVSVPGLDEETQQMLANRFPKQQ